MRYFIFGNFTELWMMQAIVLMLIVATSANSCLCLLNSFSVLWKNSGVLPTLSACTVSRWLFNLLKFMLSIAKIFTQNKHYGLSSPWTSISVNLQDIFCIVLPAFQSFAYCFSTWTSLIVFYQTSLIISIFLLVTTHTCIHHCKGCQ